MHVHEKFDGCSREAFGVAHRGMETVKMRSDEDPNDFLYTKDRCRDRLISVILKEGPSGYQYENIILQCLPPEYNRIPSDHIREGRLQLCRYSADDVEDLRRQLHPLQLLLVNRYRGTRRRYVADGVGPQQHNLPLLQQVWSL